MIERGAVPDPGGHDWMFEQHARWLEELQEYTGRKEAVTCRAGYMPLTAIAQEIATMRADASTSSGPCCATTSHTKRQPPQRLDKPIENRSRRIPPARQSCND
jgi:hypothetical protein